MCKNSPKPENEDCMSWEKEHIDKIDEAIRKYGSQWRDKIKSDSSDPAVHEAQEELDLIMDALRLDDLEQKRQMLVEFDHTLPARTRRLWLRPRYLSTAAAVLVLVAAGIWLFGPDQAASPADMQAPLVAFMPWEGAIEGEAVDGLTSQLSQALPIRLASTKGIRPISFAAVNRAIEEKPDADIGQLLGPDYLVEGATESDLDRKGYRLQILKSPERSVVMDSLFTEPDGIVGFQGLEASISRAVHRSLSTIPMNPEESLHVEGRITEDRSAYLLYRQAERDLAYRTDSTMLLAMRNLDQAAQQDASSAAIWGLRAYAYSTFGEHQDQSDERDTLFDIAEKFALRSLSIDSSSAYAFLALSDCSETRDYDYEKASEHLFEAHKIQPHSAELNKSLAELLLRTGEVEIGFDANQLARKLDPHSRVSWWYETKYLTGLGRLEDARASADALMIFDKDFRPIKSFYWGYHLIRGEYDLAIAKIEDVRTTISDEHVIDMRTFVAIESENFQALDSIYKDSAIPEKMQLFVHLKKNEMPEARAMIQQMLQENNFYHRSRIQVFPIPTIETMKADPEIQEIFGEHGIKLFQLESQEQLEI